jgi:hypothetical protein
MNTPSSTLHGKMQLKHALMKLIRGRPKHLGSQCLVLYISIFLFLLIAVGVPRDLDFKNNDDGADRYTAVKEGKYCIYNPSEHKDRMEVR